MAIGAVLKKRVSHGRLLGLSSTWKERKSERERERERKRQAAAAAPGRVGGPASCTTAVILLT